MSELPDTPADAGEDIFDVAVVGGGLIGAAAALGCARLGRRVALIDRGRPEPKNGRLAMDVRNVSLSPASRCLLEELDAWPRDALAPFSAMRIWEEQGTEVLEFTAAEVGREVLGWIAENGPLVNALWQALDKEPKVSTVLGAPLSRLEPRASSVLVEAGAARLEAKLLLGVDGARSAVRERLDVPTTELPTGHHALVTAVRTERPHGGVALQRFLLDGPLALLPARDPQQVSVVWSQSQGAAERRLGLSDEAFARELTAAAEGRLGAVLAVDVRQAFPLRQHLVASFNPQPRVLLLGDSARMLHPLAGLGANIGFEDVRALLEQLARVPASADPGGVGIWQPFARRRRSRSLLMLGAMTALKTVYAQSDPYLQWLRNVGVAATVRAGPLKQQLIREALGLGAVARA